MNIFNWFKKKEQPKPSILSPNKNVVSNQKDHELGIRIVFDNLVSEGYKIEGVNTELGIVPQIVASKAGQLNFFIVITSRGPLPVLSSEKKQACELQARKFGASCMFAPVALMATGTKDSSGEEGFYVNYRGYTKA